MSTSKHINKICGVMLIFVLVFTGFLMKINVSGAASESVAMEYESKLFDTSKVHTLNIEIDDWVEFIRNCESEEYYDCTVTIDGETFRNVAIRGKGNTSLSRVAAYGNDRYSFKIEFDHYDNANTYYGLDKLCLNNIIQDNTYMKDYLVYQMMAENGVPSPLCSYVYITVDGEDWGLYLAVEGVEDSFLARNYGTDFGELYKPDSMNMGGGRGNGKQFDMEEFMENNDFNDESQNDGVQEVAGQVSDGFGGGLGDGEQAGEPVGNSERVAGGFGGREERRMEHAAFGNETGEMPGGMPGEMPEGMPEGMPGGGMNGSADVLLQYIDDEIDSYSNIFENAKTDVSKADKTRLIEALERLNNGEDLEDTVDIETVIRYFVVHNFVLNFDSYTGSMIHNYYLYEQDGQMEMIPWDYNLAFGTFQSAGDATSLVNYPIDSPTSGGDEKERPLLDWIFDNEEYLELYHTIFSEYISEFFATGEFETLFDDTANMIAPYVEKDPTKFCTYEEFEAGIKTLREFCLLRTESVKGQLDGSIGATDETQQTGNLIDASTLQISDMGGMDGHSGMGAPGKRRN